MLLPTVYAVNFVNGPKEPSNNVLVTFLSGPINALLKTSWFLSELMRLHKTILTCSSYVLVVTLVFIWFITKVSIVQRSWQLKVLIIYLMWAGFFGEIPILQNQVEGVFISEFKYCCLSSSVRHLVLSL